MVKIKEANLDEDYQVIEELADIIWREHYISIVGQPQVDYMLDKFQSAKAQSSELLNKSQKQYHNR